MATVQLRQIQCVQTVNGEPSDNISIIVAADSPARILFEASHVFTNGTSLNLNDNTLEFNQQPAGLPLVPVGQNGRRFSGFGVGRGFAICGLSGASTG